MQLRFLKLRYYTGLSIEILSGLYVPYCFYGHPWTSTFRSYIPFSTSSFLSPECSKKDPSCCPIAVEVNISKLLLTEQFTSLYHFHFPLVIHLFQKHPSISIPAVFIYLFIYFWCFRHLFLLFCGVVCGQKKTQPFWSVWRTILWSQGNANDQPLQTISLSPEVIQSKVYKILPLVTGILLDKQADQMVLIVGLGLICQKETGSSRHYISRSFKLSSVTLLKS